MGDFIKVMEGRTMEHRCDVCKKVLTPEEWLDNTKEIFQTGIQSTLCPKCVRSALKELKALEGCVKAELEKINRPHRPEGN